MCTVRSHSLTAIKLTASPPPHTTTTLSKLYKINPSFAWYNSFFRISGLWWQLLLLNCLFSFVFSFFRIVEESSENCHRRDQGLNTRTTTTTQREREKDEDEERASEIRKRSSNLLQYLLQHLNPIKRIVNMI